MYIPQLLLCHKTSATVARPSRPRVLVMQYIQRCGGNKGLDDNPLVRYIATCGFFLCITEEV